MIVLAGSASCSTMLWNSSGFGVLARVFRTVQRVPPLCFSFNFNEFLSRTNPTMPAIEHNWPSPFVDNVSDEEEVYNVSDFLVLVRMLPSSVRRPIWSPTDSQLIARQRRLTTAASDSDFCWSLVEQARSTVPSTAASAWRRTVTTEKLEKLGFQDRRGR